VYGIKTSKKPLESRSNTKNSFENFRLSSNVNSSGKSPLFILVISLTVSSSSETNFS
tara:strand:+ start:175 stop:345 length:171 start_codon:yes stop_codon:yes gene_type:complete